MAKHSFCSNSHRDLGVGVGAEPHSKAEPFSVTPSVLQVMLPPPSAPSPLGRERRGSQAQARFPGLGTEPYVASRASAPQDSPGRPGSGDEGSQGRLLEAGQDGRSCWTSSRRF